MEVCAGVCAAYIVISRKQKIRRKFWMSYFLKQHSKMDTLQEVCINNCLLFKNFTRMSTKDSELLLQMIRPKISQDTNMTESIPNSTRLAVILRFLAMRDSNNSSMDTLKISVTISHIIPEVCMLLCWH